ncbi:hypothetical protein [Neptunomonas sp.]|uniref:hypothetical protein n=1 Tax=Neptunomonas sp. TaxID=1971898 RepID=UPI0035630C15
MQPKTAIPTDNIYKFYALSGLVSTIVLVVLFFQLNEEYNRRVFDRYLQTSALQGIITPTLEQKVTLHVLERQSDLDASNKQFYSISLGVFISWSLIAMITGFWQWHTKIQPIHTEICRHQLIKLKHEIVRLKRNL